MLRRLLVFFALALAAAAPAAAQDAADAIVRLNRLENQMRQISGQLEQLQYENRQLKDQLRKFQEDVEFRFQEVGGRGGAKPSPSTTPAPRPVQPQAQPQTTPQRRSDVFDPSQDPSAPGAPRPLGTTPPSAPLAEADGQGEQFAGIGELIEEEEQAVPGGALGDEALGDGMPLPQGALPGRSSPSVAATSVGDPRADFEMAYGAFAQKNYDQAEMGFRRFLQSNPRDRLVPEATFWLGETYLQRSRYREAAEQFLSVSADHPNAAKAPDAMLRLGMALNGLGARDRACAVFAELDRKYPQASANVRQGSEREQKRNKCT
ncbi:tol-pal system protein YbgF [Microvirga pakistanensis]|uniref:tol-pal system protein YbgF n=1 Tax=Microvirga pakistanensis TaxID=1682650 RepID=UPI00106A7BED|nr:tol-pal system protein YbgF [Microvirga pakistanensis]